MISSDSQHAVARGPENSHDSSTGLSATGCPLNLLGNSSTPPPPQVLGGTIDPHQDLQCRSPMILERPSPGYDLRLINAVLVCIVAALDLQIAIFFLCVSPDLLQLRSSINRIDRQAKTIDLIVDS